MNYPEPRPFSRMMEAHSIRSQLDCVAELLDRLKRRSRVCTLEPEALRPIRNALHEITEAKHQWKKLELRHRKTCANSTVALCPKCMNEVPVDYPHVCTQI